MSADKQEVSKLLEFLPNDCMLEDMQYHLYVLEKIRRGTERAEQDGTLSHADAELRLGAWLLK